MNFIGIIILVLHYIVVITIVKTRLGIAVALNWCLTLQFTITSRQVVYSSFVLHPPPHTKKKKKKTKKQHMLKFVGLV